MFLLIQGNITSAASVRKQDELYPFNQLRDQISALQQSEPQTASQPDATSGAPEPSELFPAA